MNEHFPKIRNILINFENVLIDEKEQLNFKVEETLAELIQMGLKLILITDYSPIKSEKLLKELGINKYFSAIYSKESLSFEDNKYKARLINYIMDKENLALSQTVLIGNQEQDRIDAKKNQLNCIIVNQNYTNMDSLLQVQAHTYIDDFCLVSGL